MVSGLPVKCSSTVHGVATAIGGARERHCNWANDSAPLANDNALSAALKIGVTACQDADHAITPLGVAIHVILHHAR
eukprot:1198890-Prorocentrum_lima.AAC.1